MANIEDYLDWRGDIPFSVDPFNDVDNLILADLAYTPFDGIVPGPDFSKTISLKDACDRFFEMHSDEEIMASNMTIKVAPYLMKRMVQGLRFSEIQLTGYISEFDDETEMQFSVTTFILPDKSYYVAFRGTDDTIVGWKEDFNMGFLYETPGQMKAVEYLNRNFVKRRCKLRVGGHSKGANFAVFASAFCDTSVQKKILQAYSNDGPGFRHLVTESEGYLRILPRVTSIIPEQSMIGMILANTYEHRIVKSSKSGPYQHDAMSWQVLGNDFVLAEQLSEQSQIIDHTLTSWLEGLSDETRKIFVDVLFEAILDSGVGSLNNLGQYRKEIFTSMLKSVHKIPKEDQKVFLEVLNKLAKSGGESVIQTIRHKK